METTNCFVYVTKRLDDRHPGLPATFNFNAGEGQTPESLTHLCNHSVICPTYNVMGIDCPHPCGCTEVVPEMWNDVLKSEFKATPTGKIVTVRLRDLNSVEEID